MTSQSSFEKKLLASPRSFFLAVAAMIVDGEISSLSEIGLMAETLASVVDETRVPGTDLSNARDALTKAIARSGLPSNEVQPYADALARRRALNPGSLPIADFSSHGETEEALRGPAAHVWLSCSAARFSLQAAWAALADNPAAQDAVLAHPEVLLDQAIYEGNLPLIGQRAATKQRECLRTNLLLALVERMGASESSDDRKAGMRFACGALEMLADDGQLEKAKALARHAIQALSMDSTLDPGGALIGHLATFAMRDEATLEELARAAPAIRILPSLHSGKSLEDPKHGFVFAPSGHGGLNFPSCSPSMDQSFFTLAEYALAFGNAPDPTPMARKRSANPDKFSHELEVLSAKMRELGLADDVEAHGTPAALRDLVSIQLAIEAGSERNGRGAAAMDAYLLMAQSSQGNIQSKMRRRI